MKKRKKIEMYHGHVRMTNEERKVIERYIDKEIRERGEYYSFNKFMRDAAREKINRGET